MAELYTPDYVQIEIEGTDRTEYVISYERKSSICEMGDSFTLELSPEHPTVLNPYDSIVIRERYGGSATRVLRGYLVDITKSYDPGSYIIQGADKSIRLFDYFIPEQLESNGESVNYWISYLAGLAGLSVSFQASSNVTVDPGTPLGFQTVGDAIARLERLAAYYVKYDSVLDKLKTFRLNTSEPQITVDTAVAAERTLSTDKTRNVVKVYGGFRFNIETGLSEQVFATARTEISELIADKTVVVTNPAITRQLYSYIVASRILSVVNSIDDIQLFTLDGFYPTLQVGEIANIDWHEDWNYDGSRVITSIYARVGPDGATTRLTFGEKCPRLSIALPPSPVYVSTISGGVGVSWDGGESFVPTNAGLTTAGELNVSNISVNSYGQSMIITEAGIYRRPYFTGFWVAVPDLPTPVNDVGDDEVPQYTDLKLKKVVDEPTRYGTFHVLVSGPSIMPTGFFRAWIYTTKNFGTTWGSIQLHTPPSGIVPSGSDYDVVAHDIIGAIDNSSYVLISGRPTIITETPVESIYWAKTVGNARLLAGVWDGEGPITSLPLNVGLTNANGIYRIGIWSLPSNRTIAYAAVIHADATHTHVNGARCEVFRTNDSGVTWDKIHDEQFFTASANDRYRNYRIHFDPDSDTDAARICFSGWEDVFSASANTFIIHARVVTDNPISEISAYVDYDETIDSLGTSYNMNGASRVSQLAVDSSGKCFTLQHFWRVTAGPSETHTHVPVISIDFSTGDITHEFSINRTVSGSGTFKGGANLANVRTGNIYSYHGYFVTTAPSTIQRFYENSSVIKEDIMDTSALGIPGFGNVEPVGMEEDVSNNPLVRYTNGATTYLPNTDFDDDYMIVALYPEPEQLNYQYFYGNLDKSSSNNRRFCRTLDFIDFEEFFTDRFEIDPSTGQSGNDLDAFDYRTFE